VPIAATAVSANSAASVSGTCPAARPLSKQRPDAYATAMSAAWLMALRIPKNRPRLAAGTISVIHDCHALAAMLTTAELRNAVISRTVSVQEAGTGAMNSTAGSNHALRPNTPAQTTYIRRDRRRGASTAVTTLPSVASAPSAASTPNSRSLAPYHRAATVNSGPPLIRAAAAAQALSTSDSRMDLAGSSGGAGLGATGSVCLITVPRLPDYRLRFNRYASR
jgi:hypothetical protein